MRPTRFKWWRVIQTMERAGVQFADGLSVGELSAVESSLGTRLPPDHRALLREVLPAGPGFPNWRELGNEALETQLAWPFASLAEDIVSGRFWWAERWGPRPAAAQEAVAVARRDYEKAPGWCRCTTTPICRLRRSSRTTRCSPGRTAPS